MKRVNDPEGFVAKILMIAVERLGCAYPIVAQ